MRPAGTSGFHAGLLRRQLQAPRTQPAADRPDSSPTRPASLRHGAGLPPCSAARSRLACLGVDDLDPHERQSRRARAQQVRKAAPAPASTLAPGSRAQNAPGSAASAAAPCSRSGSRRRRPRARRFQRQAAAGQVAIDSSQRRKPQGRASGLCWPAPTWQAMLALSAAKRAAVVVTLFHHALAPCSEDSREHSRELLPRVRVEAVPAVPGEASRKDSSSWNRIREARA